MRPLIVCFILWGQSLCVLSQSSLLKSGPMVGDSKPAATQLWVQTISPAKVKIYYCQDSLTSGKCYYTNEYVTNFLEGNTAHLLADKTVEGKKYFYTLYINDTLVSLKYPLSFRVLADTDKKLTDFKLAAGSCVYINDSVTDKADHYKGGSYEIYTAICKQQPDMMLWVGDNVYFRKKDWTSKEGMIYRYSHTRSLPEMQPLLGSTANYAVWDDHDYGPNDSDKSFENKKASLEVFKLFWANPSNGFDQTASPNTSFIKEDVQFFLLDDRTFRDPVYASKERREILGEAQLKWLIKGLKESTSTFKVVVMGGQVLNPLKLYENYSKYEEWTVLLDQLSDSKIGGVIFISGDRHFSEAMKLERKELKPLYEFTVSPLNSRPYVESNEVNPIRVEGSLIRENNFATFEFTGDKLNRKMIVRYYDKTGKILFEQSVSASEL